MKREQALNTINELPREFEVDELLERLVFIDKVQHGMNQVKAKKTISHEKVKKLVKKW